MNKKDEDLYIALIRYGRDHLKEGVDRDQAKQYLIEKGYSFDDGDRQFLFTRLFNDTFVSQGFIGSKGFLLLSSYFNLLEYEELNEARQQAKDAKKMAIIAIFISAFLALASIGFSYYQVTHPQDVIIKNKTERKQ